MAPRELSLSSVGGVMAFVWTIVDPLLIRPLPRNGGSEP